MLIAINAKLSFSMDKYWQTPKIISGWNISCSVDDGSISGNGNNWFLKQVKMDVREAFLNKELKFLHLRH